MNLGISDYRSWKINYNGTEPEPIFLEPNIENPLFNSCVGVWVGGHPPTNFCTHESKDVLENFISFDAYEIPATGRG